MNVRQKKTRKLNHLSVNILVVLEIEERKQFLDQMTTLGKRREYQQVISNEIADVRIFKNDYNVNLFSFFRKYVKWNKSIDNVQKP
jgi:hypothetical protein